MDSGGKEISPEPDSGDCGPDASSGVDTSGSSWHLLPEQFKTVLDKTEVSFTLLDRDYRILDFNCRSTEYAEAVFGKPLVPGESILSYTTPEAKPLLLRDLARAFGGEEVRFEWEYETRGEPYWFYFIHIPFRDSSGDVTRVALCTLDLTLRRKSEARERELATAIDKSPITVLLTDAGGSIRYVNSFFEELTGYSADEVIGKNPRFLQSGLTSAETYKELWRELTAGRVWRGEFTNKKSDGTLYQERAILVPITDDTGNLTTIVGLKEDITPLRETIEELTQKEAHFRAIFDNAGDAIYIHDTTGIIRDVNLTALEQTGYTRDELIGTHIGALDATTGKEPPPEVAELIRSVDPAGGLRDGETTRHVRFSSMQRRKDGTLFPVEIVLFLFPSRDETLIAASVTDITDRRLQEDRLQRSLMEKEALIQELHHRVKNNLQSVASLIKLQADSVQNSGDREIFEKNADRAYSMAMVHQMLYQANNLTEIDLAEYLRELAAYSSGWAASRYQPTEVRVTGDSVNLSIDRAVPLGLMVNELISNAVKYCCTDEGDAGGSVSVTFNAGAESLTLEVCDSGDAEAPQFFTEHAQGFGTQLINLLAQQISATVEPLPGPGGRIRVTVPLGI